MEEASKRENATLPKVSFALRMTKSGILELVHESTGAKVFQTVFEDVESKTLKAPDELTKLEAQWKAEDEAKEKRDKDTADTPNKETETEEETKPEEEETPKEEEPKPKEDEDEVESDEVETDPAVKAATDEIKQKQKEKLKEQKEARSEVRRQKREEIKKLRIEREQMKYVTSINVKERVKTLSFKVGVTLDYSNARNTLQTDNQRVQLMTEEMKAAAGDKIWKLNKRDKDIKDTKDAKNSFESAIYAARDWLENEEHLVFTKESEREQILANLTTWEDWLYESESDETAETYKTKHLSLDKVVGPILER